MDRRRTQDASAGHGSSWVSAHNILFRAAANLLFLPIAALLMLVSLFLIAMSAGMNALPFALGLAFGAYRFGLWPSVASSTVFVFGYVLWIEDPECAADPGCDGSSADAWPDAPFTVLAYFGILMAGIVAGVVRDVRRRRDPAG